MIQKDAHGDGLATSRMLAVNFVPGTTRLHVRTGTSTNWDAGIDQTESLPLNVATQVRVEAFGSIVRVSYNGRIVAAVAVSGTRLSGFAHLYASWTDVGAPANALFGKYSMSVLEGGLTLPSFMTAVEPLAARYAGLVELPKDYTVSFEVTLKQVSAGWTSILLLRGVL